MSVTMQEVKGTPTATPTDSQPPNSLIWSAPEPSRISPQKQVKKKKRPFFFCCGMKEVWDEEHAKKDKLPIKSAVVAQPVRKFPLLQDIDPANVGKKCLVLDLDETLVHSSFKAVDNPDFVIPVEIDNQVHNVFVLKRPGVDQFLLAVAQHFELVVFTASLAKYADPVLDALDASKVVSHRLFREACVFHKGNYVKDLGQLGRDLKDVIILDNSPASYILHPFNAVPISSWFNDPADTELIDLIPFLEELRFVDDVSAVLCPTNRE